MTMMGNMNEPCSKVNSASITVGLTRVQLPDNKDASWVQLMHEHATAKVYIGGEGVTVANGFGSMAVRDTTERYPVHNTNVLWAISDIAGVTLRILWGE